MANNENLIPIPGRLHSVATEGHVSGADEIYDDTQQKDQATINSELISAVGTGGSVDSKIATAKTEIIGDAATDYNTLGKLEDKIQAEATRAEAAEEALDGRVDTLEEAVGTGGSVDSRISAAVATEATRAQAAEADRYTKSETYSKTELNNLITTPNQEYVSVIATAQTTAVTDVLPATGAADTTYRVGNWDGTQYNDSVFSEYAWDGSAYIKLSTKSQVGEVYDISANHADTKYADLAAALGTNGANIPQSLRKGGMSVKFVQSSDNKYVQYRLTKDSWSIDTEDWVIADEGVYVENPEFVYVKTDNEGKILWAIKTDGNIYYGAGVPQQVIDYIEKKIADLSLDEYEDIVAFLNNLEKGDKTLQTLLKEKVDKEEGKSLIDSEYASTKSTIDSPEFLEVTLDEEDKVLAGRTTNGEAFEKVGVSTPKISVDGTTVSNVSDLEERIEIKTDGDGRILSYRGKNGKLYEQAGIETDSIILSQCGIKKLQDNLNAIPVEKKWHLPKYGKVVLVSETFYLTANPGWGNKDDIVCIQMLDDTVANAQQKKTLSYYYIKSTLTPIAGGGYDRTSVNEDSIKLDLFAAKDIVESGGQFFVKNITKVNGYFYLTSTLDAIESGGVTTYYVNSSYSVKVNTDIVAEEQETLSNAIEVTPITDVPPYKAWPISKKPEHCIIANIDFGDFYKKNNVPISIKYQGNTTMGARKRGFRLTFYKNNAYAKKNKIKFGEMLRLSGYNMKSFYARDERVGEPVANNMFIEMYESRGKDCYPWNKDNILFNGATGTIKSFPIETWFGDEFFGLQFFSLKKDEKNYMLDGDDDSSGIFVSGEAVSGNWADTSAREWADEMGVDGRELAYPDLFDDSVSVETAAALNELFKYTKGFVDGSIEIGGQIVEFKNFMLEEYINVENWIDYWIGCQVFQTIDNMFHNVILYSGSDKKKFYLFFYDLDNTLNYNYNADIIDICQDAGVNVDFWIKFIDVYKDNIINRYYDLRRNILTQENIQGIYDTYTSFIPKDIIEAEISKWGSGRIKLYENKIKKFNQRIEWFDRNNFNL